MKKVVGTCAAALVLAAIPAESDAAWILQFATGRTADHQPLFNRAAPLAANLPSVRLIQTDVLVPRAPSQALLEARPIAKTARLVEIDPAPVMGESRWVLLEFKANGEVISHSVKPAE